MNVNYAVIVSGYILLKIEKLMVFMNLVKATFAFAMYVLQALGDLIIMFLHQRGRKGRSLLL